MGQIHQNTARLREYGTAGNEVIGNMARFDFSGNNITLKIGLTTVAPVPSVRDLGIFLDSDLVMRTHVCQTASRCFAALPQLGAYTQHPSPCLGNCLPIACRYMVLCRVDYGNGTLHGWSPSLTIPSTSVSSEHSGHAHFAATSLRPHH